MPQVETALGAIDVEDIGMCLMHEHIIIADWDMRSNYDDYVDIEKKSPRPSSHSTPPGSAGSRPSST